MDRQMNSTTNKQKYDDPSKMYILQNIKLSDLTLDDIYDPLDSNRSGWKAKARAFRERKERQFHHEF